MSNENLKDKVAGSLAWKFMERGGIQVIQFVVSIVIARLLEPTTYGAVALVTVFISLATVFVQSGLSSALVQKKDADSVEYSSVFYYSLAIATCLYTLLFFMAGPIADFYELPQLKGVLRIMSFVLFPGALNSVQVAVLSKEMCFKLQFYSGFVAAIISGVLGIVLAVMGFGIWALVTQQLTYQVLICILLWLTVKWRPTLEFSYKKTKSLLKYGSKLLFSNLVDTLYVNIESLIIGKKYSEADLALFSKGKQFPAIIIDNVNSSVQSVLFVAYSKKQDDILQIKNMLRRAMSLITYLVFPAMLGLAVVAEPLILLLLGEQWKDCVIYMQIYCVISAITHMQATNLQALNAVGKADVYLRINIVKKILGVIALAVAVLFFNKVQAIAFASFVMAWVALLLNVYISNKYLAYSAWEFTKDVTPNVICSLVMVVVALLSGWSIQTHFWKVIVEVSVGIISYLGVSFILKNKNLSYLRDYFVEKTMKRGQQ